MNNKLEELEGKGKPTEDQKANLDQAIKDAETALKDPNLSKEDKDALQKEIDKAKDVQKDPNASGKDVEDATNDLNNKLEELENKGKPTDKQKADLEQAIQDAETALKDPKLSAEGKKELDQAIKNAKDTLNSPKSTGEDMEKATKDLNDTVAKTKPQIEKPSKADKDALEKAIEDGQKYLDANKDVLDAADQGALEDALKDAVTVNSDDKASKTEVKEATDHLNDLVEELKAKNKPATTEDKKKLEDKIKEVEEGTKDLVISKENQKELDKALEHAKEVAKDDKASEADVNNAIQDLEDIFNKIKDDQPTDETQNEVEDAKKDAENLKGENGALEDLDVPGDISKEDKEAIEKELEDAIKEAEDAKSQKELEDALQALEDAIAKVEQAKAAKKGLEEARQAVKGAKDAAKAMQKVVDKLGEGKQLTEAETKQLVDGMAQFAEASDKVAIVADRYAEERTDLFDDLGSAYLNMVETSVDLAVKEPTKQSVAQAQDHLDRIQLKDEAKKKELQKKLDAAQKVVDDVEFAFDKLKETRDALGTDAFESKLKVANDAVVSALRHGDKVNADLRDAMQAELERLKVEHERDALEALVEASTKLPELQTARQPDEVLKTEQYVTEAEKEALYGVEGDAEQIGALEKAKNALNAAKTSKELSDAKTALEQAMNPYLDPKNGSKTVAEAMQKALETANDNRADAAKGKAALDEVERLLGEYDKAGEVPTEQVKEDVKALQDYVGAVQAIEKAKETKRQADVDTAKDLIAKVAKEKDQTELTERLNKNVQVEKLDKNALNKAIQAGEAKLQAADKYDAESVQALRDAIVNGKKVAQDDAATEEAVQQAAERVLIATEALVEKAAVQLTDLTRDAQLDLHPIIKQITEDRKKTAGGVLGLNIGILDLGLLSSEQIGKISDMNRHTIDVVPGTELEATAEVAIHTVLGGHSFKVHVFKENPQGDYVKIATHRGSSGGFLFIANTAKMPLGLLDEGKYEVVLEVGAGLTVIQGIPYHITNQVLYDYRQVAKDAEIKGNFFEEGSTKGGANAGKIASVQGGPADRVVAVTKEKEKEQYKETKIQGTRGTLYMTADGNYRYQPDHKRQNTGLYEDFKVKAVNDHNGTESEATLRVRIDSSTIEWIPADGTTAKIVEATDKKAETAVETKRTLQKNTFKGSDKRGTGVRASGIQVNGVASTLSFSSRVNAATKGPAVIEVIHEETGKVVQTYNINRLTDDEMKLEPVTGLKAGTYSINVKENRDNRHIHIYNVQVDEPVWNKVDMTITPESKVQGNLIDESKDYLGADSTQFDLTSIWIDARPVAKDGENKFVKYEVDKQGNFKTVTDKKGNTSYIEADKNSIEGLTSYMPVGLFSGFQRLEGKYNDAKPTQNIFAGQYGILEIDNKGAYTYTPFNRIEAAGQTEVFEYRIVHPSGKRATAKLEIDIAPLTAVSEGHDIVTSTKENDRFKTLGGSDTVVYNVLDDDDHAGGNGKDEWVDFTFGAVVQTDADLIDLSALFGDEVVTNLNVDKYIAVKNNADGSATIRIDRDGVAGKYEMTDLITLKGTKDAPLPNNVTLKQLLANGQILY